MDSKIQALLADLYALDPSLRNREQELIPVLTTLLKAQPDAKLDAAFAAKLRHKLITPPQTKSLSALMSAPILNKFALAGAGGLIALVIAVPLTYQLARSNVSLPSLALSDFSSTPSIKNLGADAFGALTGSGTAAPLGAPGTRSSTGFGMGGGGGNAVSESAPVPASDKMIAPGEPYYGDIIKYVYTYTGEALDLTNVSDAVYKKTGGLDIGNAGRDLTRSKFGPVDIGAFGNMQLQTFNVKQADKNGYGIYVDPENGMISIYGNEGLWGYSNEYVPLTEGDILSNDAAIALSNKFLTDYQINTTGFGSPVIDDRNLVYALSQPASIRYIPDTINITYPLLLEGQPAYNNDGSAYGLFVMVNMRTKAVTSVSINLAKSYDKSSYELERDSAKILSLAAQGGLYTYPQEGVTKTVNIELGTPEIILTSHYSYANNQSELLFIPALSFPVTKNSDTDPIYSDKIVIPLVKSVIEEANQAPIAIPLDTVKAAE